MQPGVGKFRSGLEIIDSEMCSTGWGNLVAKKKKQKQINNPASNNRGILIAAAFHFVAAVEEHLPNSKQDSTERTLRPRG